MCTHTYTYICPRSQVECSPPAPWYHNPVGGQAQGFPTEWLQLGCCCCWWPCCRPVSGLAAVSQQPEASNRLQSAAASLRASKPASQTAHNQPISQPANPNLHPTGGWEENPWLTDPKPQPQPTGGVGGGCRGGGGGSQIALRHIYLYLYILFVNIHYF